MRCRALASKQHPHVAVASVRHADRRLSHSAHAHHAPGSAIVSASTGQCPDPPRSPPRPTTGQGQPRRFSPVPLAGTNGAGKSTLYQTRVSPALRVPHHADNIQRDELQDPAMQASYQAARILTRWTLRGLCRRSCDLTRLLTITHGTVGAASLYRQPCHFSVGLHQ